MRGAQCFGWLGAESAARVAEEGVDGGAAAGWSEPPDPTRANTNAPLRTSTMATATPITQPGTSVPPSASGGGVGADE